MNFETRDKDLDIDKQESLFIGGREAGWIITRNRESGRRYQVCIRINDGSIGLIQGHGATKEEAVLKALRSGRESCHKCLFDIESLENALGVSTGPALPMDAPSE